MGMLDRIIQAASFEGGLTRRIQLEIEERNLNLPLEVSYVGGDGPIPAKVTHLHKLYFVVVLGNPPRAVKVSYNGEFVGAKRRIPKKHESPHPRDINPGVYGKDLQLVRVLSGRTAIV